MPARNTPSASPRAQRWLRIVIVAVGSVTFSCFLALSPLVRAFVKQDRAGSTARIGVGTVEQIVPPHIEENAAPLPAQVWVRVNGRLTSAESVFGSAQLKVGGEAQVTYRIGRSGRVYVDRVEPLPGPREPSSRQ